MARILVLDGHSQAALSVTRSAGRAGHWVAVGANAGMFAPAKLSRYCRTQIDYPVSTEDAGYFVESILAFARAQSIDLIIPVTDWTLGPLSAEREHFAGICHIAMPAANALEYASDKYRTMKLAESLGIAVPKTFLVKSVEDLPLEEVRFPAVVKDRFSVRWINGKAVPGSVSYAFSPVELKSMVSNRLRAAGDVMIQNFISGAGIGFSCFVAGGKGFIPFQWQRIREVDPRGSASSARKSIGLNPSVVSLSVRLVAEMGFEGIVMVEYKRAEDGQLILMEINGRPWGSIGLPMECGIDYARFLIEWSLRGTLPPEHLRYRENVLCRKAIGELTHLESLRAGPPAQWPVPYPSFWTSLLAMAIPWRPGMRYDDVWLSDPRPGIAGLRNWFRVRGKAK